MVKGGIQPRDAKFEHVSTRLAFLISNAVSYFRSMRARNRSNWMDFASVVAKRMAAAVTRSGRMRLKVSKRGVLPSSTRTSIVDASRGSRDARNSINFVQRLDVFARSVVKDDLWVSEKREARR